MKMTDHAANEAVWTDTSRDAGSHRAMSMMSMRRMRISFLAFLGWVMPGVVVVGAIGAYPTWKLHAQLGLMTELVAGALVLTVAMLSACVIIRRAAAGGHAKAALAFVTLGWVRVLLSAALALVIWSLFGLPPRLMLIWIAVFYLVVLTCECFWLIQALQRERRRLPDREITDGEPTQQGLEVAKEA